jgi:hypothetical protein
LIYSIRTKVEEGRREGGRKKEGGGGERRNCDGKEL